MTEKPSLFRRLLDRATEAKTELRRINDAIPELLGERASLGREIGRLEAEASQLAQSQFARLGGK